MSITFKLEIDGLIQALNFSNGNAAALLALAGLPSMPHGEIPPGRLDAHIIRLLWVANTDSLRTPKVATAVEAPRWSEGARTDEYLQRRVGELLEMLACARRNGCGVTWG